MIKNAALITLLGFTIISCEECMCESYNEDHPINDWSLFPEEKGYTFSGTTAAEDLNFVFNQGYKTDKSYLLRQGGCRDYCDQRYIYSLRSEEIKKTLECQLFISDYDEYKGSVTYVAGYDSENFRVVDGSLFPTNANGTSQFSAAVKSSVSIDGTSYSDVVEIVRTTPVTGEVFDTLWVKKHEGLIGFTFNAVPYKRTN